MTVGENIKYWRNKNNMSQTELANILDISDKTVSSWEVNRTEPNIVMIEKICSALKCKKTDIIGPDISEDNYYLDEDAREAADFLHKNPEYKVLFDASKKISKDDIEFVAKMLDKFRK